MVVMFFPVWVPVVLLVALLIRSRLGSPVFFTQARGGYKGKSFLLWKFRTMTDDKDQCGNLLPDAQRITALGMLLRRTSLDELPSLWNVLRGEMSLVGPRPLLVRYKQRYNKEQARRHEARPGVTGWAQVNGRNAIGWDEKFALDVWYTDHQSFWLDLKILLFTIAAVVKRTGIAHPGEETMPEFMGSNHASN